MILLQFPVSCLFVRGWFKFHRNAITAQRQCDCVMKAMRSWRKGNAIAAPRLTQGTLLDYFPPHEPTWSAIFFALSSFFRLFHIQYQSLQIFTLGMVDVNGMVSWLMKLMKNPYFPVSLRCCSEYRRTEMLFSNYL